MENSDFTITLFLDRSPDNVFKAVSNARGWWSENIEGNTSELHAEFRNHYRDIHSCKMKITEFIPGKKIVWHVLESRFNFTKNKNEWTGNDIIFEMTELDKQTQFRFTQKGLTPAYECYDVCREGWTNYIANSLYKFITTGEGQPTPKE